MVPRCEDGQGGYGRKRLRPGTYSGSLVLGEERLRDQRRRSDQRRQGRAYVEVLAENDFDDYVLSSPAISDGQIFIRTAKFLYCIGKRAS